MEKRGKEVSTSWKLRNEDKNDKEEEDKIDGDGIKKYGSQETPSRNSL